MIGTICLFKIKCQTKIEKFFLLPLAMLLGWKVVPNFASMPLLAPNVHEAGRRFWPPRLLGRCTSLSEAAGEAEEDEDCM